MTRRLLFVVNDAGYFLSHRLPLACAARDADWEVHVATALSPAQEQIRGAGFAVHSVPLTRSGLRPDREIATMIAIWRLLRRLKPDLAHFVTLKAVVTGGLAARLAGVPASVFAITGLGHVFTDSGIKGRILRLIFRLLLPFLVTKHTRIIVQNREDGERIAFSRAIRQRLKLIRGSGVDIDQFSACVEPPEPVTILLASRMIWKKGVGDLVEAARLLKAKGVGVKILLAGDSDPGNPGCIATAQLSAWNQEDNIEWLGFQSDMPALMARCHIVCLPSYYGEGVPKCLIEAAAAGRPIVTTDMPGCRDIVWDRENGLLVPARNPEALATALKILIDDSELRRHFGARGRAIVAEGFSSRQVIAETIAVYDALRP